MILTKLDQHVNEMMTTAGKKFLIFLRSRFLIIMQNINMVAIGKRNSRLNPKFARLRAAVMRNIAQPLASRAVATLPISPCRYTITLL